MGRNRRVRLRKNRKIWMPENSLPIPLPIPVEQNVRTYDQGYADGVFDGGEKYLERHHPVDVLIPDLSVEGVVVAGLQALRPQGVPLLKVDAVASELESCLLEKRPYSLVRLGDGELLTLAQEIVLPIEEVRHAGPFLPYAGVVIPDLAARDALVYSIRRASLIGVPSSRRPYFQPLLFQTLRAHGIECRSLRYTTSIINFSLLEHGYLMKLLAGRRVVVVGNVAGLLAQALTAQGVHLAGVVSPVNGIQDTHRVIEEVSGLDFDLALVSAGIAALPICVNLAEKTGKVMLDFGHMANLVAGLPL